MKQTSKLVLLFAWCVMSFSCLEDKRIPTTTSIETPDAAEKSIADTQKTESAVKQNNIEQRNKSEIDTLKKDTAKTKTEDIVKAEAAIPAMSVVEENRFPSFFEVLALGFSVFALVMCFAIFRLTRRLAKDVSREVRELGRDCSNLHAENAKMSERCTKTEGVCSELRYEMGLLSLRIGRLESNRIPTKEINHESGSKTEGSKNDKEQAKKRGYFGIVKVGGGIALFNDYPKSPNDGAYFEVDYLDDNHCEFAPIELDKIRSIDAVGEAIEYNGDMAYAKSLKVLQKGKAVFDKQHFFWKITEKARIELKE